MTAYVFLIGITLFAHVFYKYYYIVRRRKYQFSQAEIDYKDACETIEKKTFTVFFVIYIVLLCLRDNTVGIDTKSYINIFFYRFQTMPWRSVIENTSDELGFALLSKLITSISSEPQVFIAVLALVSVIPIMILYRNEADDALLCCSFFLISLLFEAFFSALREGVALGFVVPAFYCVKRKKPLLFILIVLIASSFHLSALILIALYPVYHAKITYKWLWIVVPVMFVIFRYNAVIFNTIFYFVGGKYLSKYSVIGYEATGQYGLLILFILISIYSFIIADNDALDNNDIGLRNILLLATTLQFFAPLHVNASRMNYYFIVFIPIALTRVNTKCKHRLYQVAVLAKYVMVVFFVFYFLFGKGDTLRIQEYQFCF